MDTQNGNAQNGTVHNGNAQNEGRNRIAELCTCIENDRTDYGKQTDDLKERRGRDGEGSNEEERGRHQGSTHTPCRDHTR